MCDGDKIKAQFKDCIARSGLTSDYVVEDRTADQLIAELRELLRNNPGITRDEAHRLLTNYVTGRETLPPWLIMAAIKFLVMLIINQWFADGRDRDEEHAT